MSLHAIDDVPFKSTTLHRDSQDLTDEDPTIMTVQVNIHTDNMIIHMNSRVIQNQDVSSSVLINFQETILTYSVYYRTLLQMWKTGTP